MFPSPSACPCPSPLHGRSRARGVRTERGAGAGWCLVPGVRGGMARCCGRAGQSQDEPLLHGWERHGRCWSGLGGVLRLCYFPWSGSSNQTASWHEQILFLQRFIIANPTSRRGAGSSALHECVCQAQRHVLTHLQHR